MDNSLKLQTDTLSRTARWSILVAFVVIWYALIQGISHFVFHVAPEPAALPQDLAAHLLFAIICYSLSGRLRFTLSTVVAFVAALNLCNAGKIQFYGTPVMPDDFIALPNLFMLLTGWQLAGAIAIVVLPFALLLADDSTGGGVGPGCCSSCTSWPSGGCCRWRDRRWR